MGFSLREKGRPVVDERTCAGCGACVRICGDEVLILQDGKARAGEGLFIGCIACGHCVAVCPTDSISVTGRGMGPEDRIELPPSSGRATAEQLETLLLWRRSIRKYQEREVGRELIDRILAMTATAPVGIPPHEVGVIVFHGREKVQQLATDACAVFARQARFMRPFVLLLLRPFYGKAAYEAMREFIQPLLATLARLRSEGCDRFTYDAPAALLFHHGPMADPADGHIAATYAMLAAESLGLGSCLLGTTVALDHDKGFKAKYGIPRENTIGLGLTLGYPAVKFRRGVRRRLASVRWL